MASNSKELTILGTSAGGPAFKRYPSSQFLRFNDDTFLIDCGEGAQMQMTRYNLRKNNISHIFISHLHGDHIWGLAGLLGSYSMMNRKEPLTVFGPKGIKELLEAQIKYSGTNISYPLTITVTNTKEFLLIYENDNVEVFTIPLNHGMPCNGYLFKEKSKPLNIIKEKIEQYNLSYPEIIAIKNGSDLKINGIVVPNSELTHPVEELKSFAYCSDTQYDEKTAFFVKDVSLLYHEATWKHNTINNKNKIKHSSAKEAATVAKNANVKKLIIGHFSAMYANLDPLLQEAKEVFLNTELALEGKQIDF